MSLNIPQAGGVPGITGPPDWLSAPPTGNYDLDDVRWTGAMRTAFGSGGSGNNTFRATQLVVGGQQYIYLSFRVAFVPSLSNEYDNVYVGIRRTGGTKAAVIKLPVHDAMTSAGPPSASPPAALNAANVQLWTKTGGAWSPPQAAPAWVVANARAWLQQSVDVATDPNNRWAIEIRIPAAAVGNIDDGAGPNLGTDFEMWYLMEGTLATNPATPVILADYRTSGATTVGALENENFPSNFDAGTPVDRFLLTAGPASFGGVAIYGNGYSDIRVSNVYGEGIKIANGGPNTFIARPRNYRTAPNDIAIGQISATFRIANWGSIAGDPNQTNYATGTWDYVPGNSALAPVLSNAAIPAIAAGTDPPATQPIKLDATITLGAGKSLHQCILVNLSGGSLQFLNDAAFQNMFFDHASVIENDAEVNVRGVSPQPTDVVLAVEKINMLKNTPGTNEGQFLEASMARLLQRGGAYAEKVTRLRRYLGNSDASKPEQRLGNLVSALSEAGFTQRDVDTLFPTFRVHVYHDTGERVHNKAGDRVPVYKEQSSFGLYAYHEGALEGWQTSIVGATRVSEQLYRLSVPAGGTARIKIRVQAVTPGETRIPDDPIGEGGGGGPEAGGCLGAIVRLIKKLFGM